VLFWGRRVYWGAVVWVVTALRQQRTDGFTIERIRTLFGVTRSTLARGLAYFRDTFPQSTTWQRLRGRWMPPVAREAILWTVLERLGLARDGPQTALVRGLRLLVAGMV